jgi:catechol 2,3-dioxygenase-like lactoylglutathione lyase family enzyme
MTNATRPTGVHHLALCTQDIKRQIAFFSDVLGMELVALYWMDGVEGAWHGFLKLNDRCSVAFVQTPDVEKIPREIGLTHAGWAGSPVSLPLSKAKGKRVIKFVVSGLDATLRPEDL